MQALHGVGRPLTGFMSELGVDTIITTREGQKAACPKASILRLVSKKTLNRGIERVSMQAEKLSKGAPGHPTNAHESQPVKTDIPHDDVSRKQSDVQKQNPVPTQIKQGNTVTLTQVHSITSALPPRMPAFVHDQV